MLVKIIVTVALAALVIAAPGAVALAVIGLPLLALVIRRAADAVDIGRP